MKKSIIIPDKIFHKLWNAALLHSDFTSYYNHITNIDSDGYINLPKYGFDLNITYDALSKIYKAAHCSISDILKNHHLTKAALSHRFCIPIRTIENWCYQTNSCPDYTRLMILKSLGGAILPQNIYTESEGAMAVPSSHKKTVTSNSSVEKQSTEIPAPVDSNINIASPSFDNFSLKQFEAEHLNYDSHLSDTDYLSKENRLRRKNIRINLD